MNDRELERRMRRLSLDQVPPSPWLEDRVLGAIEVSRRGRSAGIQSPDPRVGIALAAALVIAALIVGVLAGSRFFPRSVPAPADVTPSRNAAIVQYRLVIDADMRAVDHADARVRCRTRSECVNGLYEVRSATQRLLGDVATTPPPHGLEAMVLVLQTHAQRLIIDLDRTINSVNLTGGVDQSADQMAELAAMDEAQSSLDCWPATPIFGAHGDTCS